MDTSYQKDYYEILGVDISADEHNIKEAYRKLAFQYHPDRNKDNPAANDKMKALNEAYATLSDPAKRREYDSLRERYGSGAYEQYRQTHSQEDIFRGSDIEQIFQEFSRSYGFRDADEIFREFYGPGFHGYVYSRPGYTFRSYTTNSTQDNTSNTMPTIPFNQMGFSGKLIKFVLEKVFRIKIPEKGKDITDVLSISSEVAKQGGEVRYRYHKAGESKILLVKIPAGIKSGQKIRLREMGVPGKAGGPAGDLLLMVKIKIPFFQRIKSIFKV